MTTLSVGKEGPGLVLLLENAAIVKSLSGVYRPENR